MRSAIAPTMSAGVMAGEGHLEADVDVLGDDHAIGEGLDVRLRRDAGQEGLGEAADEGVEAGALGEGHAVSVQHPDDAHEQTQENTCISIDSMFLVRTMPP